MAKYYGMVGYIVSEDDDGFGVYNERAIERPYYGDLIRDTRREQAGEGVNDNVSIQNDISIVADIYAYQNLHRIKYVTFMGTRWNVTSVEIERPRLILSVGGVYNGPTPETAPETEGDPGD